jgi:general secretion pathway protein I
MRSGSLAPRHSRQLGFSLIELLVAFAIMALSLGLLYRMAGGSARNVTDATQYQYAAWLAESILAGRSNVRADGWNEDGESGGFRWQIRSARHSGGVNAPQMVHLHRIELSVFWDEAARPKQFNLVTLLPERKPLPGESPQ